MTNPTPTPKGLTGAAVPDDRLLYRLRDMGIQCCDLAADRIEALRERAEAADRDRGRLYDALAAARVDGWNAALLAALAETTATKAEDDTRARIRALALPAPTADGET